MTDFYFAFLRRAERRAFFREEVFFLSKPVLVALSKIFCTCGNIFSASFVFLSITNFLNCFRTFETWSFFFKLNKRFRFDARSAFLADEVIAMWGS